jgi:TRAP-type C4-dicarboxylate transport system permease small subunit
MDRTMADRSLTLIVAALLLVLTIVVFFVVLGEYLFEPMLVQ